MFFLFQQAGNFLAFASRTLDPVPGLKAIYDGAKYALPAAATRSVAFLRDCVSFKSERIEQAEEKAEKKAEEKGISQQPATSCLSSQVRLWMIGAPLALAASYMFNIESIGTPCEEYKCAQKKQEDDFSSHLYKMLISMAMFVSLKGIKFFAGRPKSSPEYFLNEIPDPLVGTLLLIDCLQHAFYKTPGANALVLPLAPSLESWITTLIESKFIPDEYYDPYDDRDGMRFTSALVFSGRMYSISYVILHAVFLFDKYVLRRAPVPIRSTFSCQIPLQTLIFDASGLENNPEGISFRVMVAGILGSRFALSLSHRKITDYAILSSLFVRGALLCSDSIKCGLFIGAGIAGAVIPFMLAWKASHKTISMLPLAPKNRPSFIGNQQRENIQHLFKIFRLLFEKKTGNRYDDSDMR